MSTRDPVSRGSAFALSLGALLVGGGLAAAAWMFAREGWLLAYLVAWQFWADLSLGALSLLLLHNLTGGNWGDAIRGRLLAAVGIIPLLAVLFLPIVLQTEAVYPWADPVHSAGDRLIEHKSPYLNVDGFQLRAVGYFTLWLALAVMLTWQGRRPPVPGSLADSRYRRFSGQGLAVHGLAVTFASIDWMMSLEPHWFSAIYGVISFASQGVAAMALAIVMFASAPRTDLVDESPHSGLPHPAADPAADLRQDLGTLLFTLLMFWAYVSFSQYFIIWNGNIPEEAAWYVRRLHGGWQIAAHLLVWLHFVLPCAVLLSREWKRDRNVLRAVAVLVLFMHWVDVLWRVTPAGEQSRLRSTAVAAACTLAVGGAWGLACLMLLKTGPQTAAARSLEEAGHA
jgi:hypothetical protein